MSTQSATTGRVFLRTLPGMIVIGAVCAAAGWVSQQLWGADWVDMAIGGVAFAALERVLALEVRSGQQ